MAKHVHIYPHKRTTSDRAALAIAAGRGNTPMRAPTRDSDDYAKLVDALFESLKDKGHVTQDAGFDESKVKRDEGGKFSAQQHAAASVSHAAESHKHLAAAKSSKGESERAHSAANPRTTGNLAAARSGSEAAHTVNTSTPAGSSLFSSFLKSENAKAAPAPAPASPHNTGSSTFWNNAYKKAGQNLRRK